LEEIREVGDERRNQGGEAGIIYFCHYGNKTRPQGHKAAHTSLPSLPLTLKWHYYFNFVQRNKFQISNNLLALNIAAMDSFS